MIRTEEEEVLVRSMPTFLKVEKSPSFSEGRTKDRGQKMKEEEERDRKREDSLFFLEGLVGAAPGVGSGLRGPQTEQGPPCRVLPHFMQITDDILVVAPSFSHPETK